MFVSLLHVSLVSVTSPLLGVCACVHWPRRHDRLLKVRRPPVTPADPPASTRRCTSTLLCFFGRIQASLERHLNICVGALASCVTQLCLSSVSIAIPLTAYGPMAAAAAAAVVRGRLWRHFLSFNLLMVSIGFTSCVTPQQVVKRKFTSSNVYHY